MTDHLTQQKRSWNMIAVSDLKILNRKCLYDLCSTQWDFVFRLHGKVNKKLYKKGILPGKPDIVLAKYKAVIFVHGCFWHRHENCKKASIPKTRTEWWENKFNRNIANDKKHQKELIILGWKVIIIWECEVDEYRKQIKNNANSFENIKRILLRNFEFFYIHIK
jgi:DNA mismatch endonuclease, patch repair protein